MNLAELPYLHLIIQTCCLGVLPFYLKLVWSFYYVSKSCASRLEKGLLKARGDLNSLTCVKSIIFLLKNT